MRKHQTNANWGTFYKNDWPVLFESVKAMKDKETLWKCHSLKETEETKLKAIWNHALGPGTEIKY